MIMKKARFTASHIGLGLLCSLVMRLSLGAQSFTIGLNFTGTDQATEPALNGGFFNFPPDTMGGVGPSHIVEMVNGAYAVYNKSNGALISRTGLNTFWNTAFTNSGIATAASSSFDPRILYDAASSRWYAVAVDSRDSAASRLLVAVTTGSNPTVASTWRGFVIDADSAGTRWADFPTVGIDASGLYISSNMFSLTGGGLSTTVTVAGIPKSSLTAVTPSVTGFQVRENVPPNNIGFAFQPAVDLDGSGLPLAGLSRFNSTNIKRTDIPANFFTGGAVGSATGFITTGSVSSPSSADQPLTKPNIDTGDTRFSGNVVLVGGSLWGVHSRDLSGRSAIDWYRIDAVTNAIQQSGTISDASRSFYFPSIAANAFGDVVIGFSGSSATTFASSFAVVGATVAGTTTFSGPTLLKAGLDDYQLTDGSGRNRWGDYSATVLDPNNPYSFWTFQEFVAADRIYDGFASLADNNWAIQVTQIIVPEPGTWALFFVGAGGVLLFRRRTGGSPGRKSGAATESFPL